MSRRDTILIAILINAGLLLILFITAVTTDHDDIAKQEERVVSSESVETISVQEEKRDPLVRDEVDQVLKRVMRPSPMQAIASPSSQEEKVSSVSVSEENSLGDRGKFVEVVVKRGDFLEKIAKANATTVEEIMKVNGLLDTRLKIGQVLLLPLPDQDVLEKSKEEADKRDEEVLYYTVKSGDNPWLIAMKHRIKLEDLLRLNDLDEEKAKRLSPGDQIRIR